jgi:hypothetical protein
MRGIKKKSLISQGQFPAETVLIFQILVEGTFLMILLLTVSPSGVTHMPRNKLVPEGAKNLDDKNCGESKEFPHEVCMIIFQLADL